MKVGIFSGTFDPVHGGHIAFALAASKSAGLDKVYFLPEPLPRRKEGVTHYVHRLAMLRLALRPYPQLTTLELPDKQFTVKSTLPRLKRLLPDTELHMLLGSDMLKYLSSNEWPDAELLLAQARLIIGVRTSHDAEAAHRALQNIQPGGLVVETPKSHASSRDIRAQLQKGKDHKELLQSLRPYIRTNWLYTTLS